jgi:hypothetical protein
MATFAKALLSQSTNGRQIKVSATGSVGTDIHQAGAGINASAIDEIWIYATNIGTSQVALTVQMGSTGSYDNIVSTIPSRSGLTLLIPGLTITNSDYIRAYAATADVILLSGYVNRIT